ncbi:D-alanine--D-alanine ligase [Desulfovibrionales bacterium]
MRVLLIAGGWSNEREVALSGTQSISAALTRLGHQVVLWDPTKGFDELLDAAAACHFAFLSLHGTPGEDGLIQAMLDIIGIPYQGPGPAGSMLALNKAAAKQLFRRAGLITPDWEFLPRPPAPNWTSHLPFPLFAKANLGGSSLDMVLVHDATGLSQALDALFAKNFEVLLERAITGGTELTCAVLGDDPLPPVLIRPEGDVYFFDYASKYTQGGAVELCPAPISEVLVQQVRQAALTAHQTLNLRGCSRSDFIWRGENLYLLEINTLPGMTPTSLLPKAAAAAGLNFDALIARLIELGLTTGH